MAFELRWTPEARETYNNIRAAAETAFTNRQQSGKTKSSKQEGLFKQVHKCVKMLSESPRHPGLQNHPYSSLKNPLDRDAKVFEAYAQQNTPAAYRVFWCYGPGKQEMTIVAITEHP
jgi:hypothetical protein